MVGQGRRRSKRNRVFRYAHWNREHGTGIVVVLPGVYARRGTEFWRPGPHSPLFVQNYGYRGYFYQNVRIDVVDPITATILSALDNNTTGLSFPAATIAVPLAPTSLVAITAGRTVSLRWDAMEHAGDYEIEAGSRPGLRDLVTFKTNCASEISVPTVPPGTYFVRVKAINELGSSAVSADVRVDVR